jgi:hypothetical protein
MMGGIGPRRFRPDLGYVAIRFDGRACSNRTVS